MEPILAEMVFGKRRFRFVKMKLLLHQEGLLLWGLKVGN
jgi:hypothetical protein